MSLIIVAAIIGAAIWWIALRRRPEAAKAPVPVATTRLPAAIPETPPRPAAPVFRRGQRIGEIEIPRLRLRVPVYEGDDAGILDLGAGHVPGTAFPGAPGNVCIAAHRDKFFRALRFIKPDDEIVLETRQGPLRYVVSSTMIVKPTAVQELMPAPKRDLTLVTCYPFYYVGHAPKRFIVHAFREITPAAGSRG